MGPKRSARQVNLLVDQCKPGFGGKANTTAAPSSGTFWRIVRAVLSNFHNLRLSGVSLVYVLELTLEILGSLA